MKICYTYKSLLFCLSFFLLQVGLFAQDVNSFFVQGNKLYKQEKFTEALVEYHKIETENKFSTELYFNLANTYYKLNKVAPSVYYYEKAKKLAPNNKDILNNLNFANQMALDNIEPLPLTVLQRLDKNSIQKLHYNTWAYLAVGLLFLFSVLFLIYRFSDKTTNKRLLFITSILSLIIGLLSVVFAFHTYQVQINKKEAIVFSAELSVKKAPTLTGEEIFKIHEGTKVNVLKTQDSWTYIKLIDGQTGWIITSAIKKI
jgi:tetratricopeptide (TPR) repeat protein